MASRFAPAQALEAWRKARGDGLDRFDLARWTLSVAQALGHEALEPASAALKPLCSESFGKLLARAAIEQGGIDGSRDSPLRAQALVEAVMESCHACGVDFAPAAETFSRQALSWKLPDAVSADPYAKATMGEQIEQGLLRAWTLWEAKAIGRAVEEPQASSRAARL